MRTNGKLGRKFGIFFANEPPFAPAWISSWNSLTCFLLDISALGIVCMGEPYPQQPLLLVPGIDVVLYRASLNDKIQVLQPMTASHVFGDFWRGGEMVQARENIVRLK